LGTGCTLDGLTSTSTAAEEFTLGSVRLRKDWLVTVSLFHKTGFPQNMRRYDLLVLALSSQILRGVVSWFHSVSFLTPAGKVLTNLARKPFIERDSPSILFVPL
jgi:hypothetical protein